MSFLTVTYHATQQMPCSKHAVHAVQELARADFEQFCTAANDASLKLMGIIGCPSCGALIERLAPTSQAAGQASASCLCMMPLKLLHSSTVIARVT